MDATLIRTMFYAAEGAYSVHIGGGSLKGFGYDKVENGYWDNSDTGFKAQLYHDGYGNYILAFAGTETLVSAMAEYTPPSSGQLELPEDYQTELNSIIASSWQIVA